MSAIAFHLGVGRRAASPGERVGAREEGGERERESKALLARHHGMTKSQKEGRNVGRWKIDYEYIKLRPKIFWNEKEGGFIWALRRRKDWWSNKWLRCPNSQSAARVSERLANGASKSWSLDHMGAPDKSSGSISATWWPKPMGAKTNPERERECKGALLVSLNSSSEFSSVKNTAKSNNLRKNSIASGYDLQSLDFLGSCQQQVCFFFFLKASYIFFYTCQIETVFVLMGVLINQYVFPLLLCEWLSDECRLCAHPLWFVVSGACQLTQCPARGLMPNF